MIPIFVDAAPAQPGFQRVRWIDQQRQADYPTTRLVSSIQRCLVILSLFAWGQYNQAPDFSGVIAS